MNRIDRITNDRRGDITEHLLRDTDPSKTLCGLAIEPMLTQPACGNKRCKRCLALAAVGQVTV